MCVLIFSTFLSKTFLILRGIQRHTSKYVYWPPCQILKNLNFLDRFSKKKLSNIDLHKKPSIGSRAGPRGRTDRHDTANSRFSQFRQHA